MFSSHLFRGLFGAPFFLELLRWLLVALAFCLIPGVFAAEDVSRTEVVGSDFPSTREALVEAIEAEGLVVSAVIPFNGMLARTAGDLARPASPFAQAEIIQFCSATLAWQLLEEDAAQIALCPLAISVFSTRAEPAKVVLAYRSPGQATAGRVKAESLLRRLVQRSAELARLRW